MNTGQFQTVSFASGAKATVTLVDVTQVRDSARGALRQAHVVIEVDGLRQSLSCGNYHLPVTVGSALVDCAVTKDYNVNSRGDHWALKTDARLRVWPAGSALMEPGSLVYPLHQRWFASRTQMANEPVYVDGGESFDAAPVYYHAGLDIGGAEGMEEVMAARDGVVISAGTAALKEAEDGPFRPRYDRIAVRDDFGWVERYWHLQSIDAAVKPGGRVRAGQRIGVLGKEADAGGWSHLHFDIVARQPSGQWGTLEGYALLWQAYQRQYRPELIAVARPHAVALLGEKITLDASRSWSRDGSIQRYEWTLSDGATANGAQIQRTYSRPGTYSEVLKVTDAQGRSDWDFATVNVLDPAHKDLTPVSIHAAYWPTLDIRPGQPVTFQVRAFGTTDGEEAWDFGDGTRAATRSDGNVNDLAKNGYAITKHAYRRAGDYIVRVERAGATAHLHVRVGR